MLEIKNLSFGYSKKHMLYEGLDLSLKKGELKVIVGKSGAGKSTLFELILGNLKPIKGSIDSAKATQVFQDPYSSFHPSFSILNQISDVAKLTKIDEFLPSLELEHSLLKKLPHELSGGQLQRCSILRSMLMDRDLILLDEPTSALDNITQLSVMKMILKQLDSKAMLLITHDNDLASWCADEIIRI